MKPSLAGKKFVWLLSPPWDDVWTRQNHFTTRLARLGAEVLYVENPVAWTSTLRNKDWRHLKSGPVREVEPRLHVMRPAFSLPGQRQSDLVARLNGRVMARQIQTWLQSRNWIDYTVWCRLPFCHFVLQHLHPVFSAYDITDDYELFESQPNARARVRQREEQLLQRADVVFLASQDLQRRKGLGGGNNFWIPNGAEYDLFAAASEPGPIRPLVRDLRQPVIGYVGLTTHWMDFALLEKLGARWPGQILMLGPIAAQVEKRARSIPGIVWGGFVPQTELAEYLRGFGVCIMPHLANDLVRMSNPLKIWEYLATGKPIVSVDLPALNPVREFVDAARDHDHFIELIAHRLSTAPARPVAAAQAFARRYSWDAIFQSLLEKLGPYLEEALPHAT